MISSIKNNLKLSVVFLVITLSGCGAAYRPADIFTSDNSDIIIQKNCPNCAPWNLITQIERRVLEEPTSQINPYTFKSLYPIATKPLSDCTRKKSDNGLVTGNLGVAETARNELIGTTIMLADSAISKHLAEIKSVETNTNLFLGAATAGLTGGATVAGEVGAKALSAAATGTNAARGMFNETTYRNALSETLIGSIETDRENKKQDILAKLNSQCVADYPVSIALADVQNYLNGGSFYHGLALIREAAELANAKRRGQSIILEDELAKSMYNKQLLDKQIEEAKSRNTLNANIPTSQSQ
ncbi:MAG: hypothetical protein WAX77_02790 [Methylococcaceae bacterium]